MTQIPFNKGQLVQGTPHVVKRIAMLGNHVPRQCGIATFTTDLSTAIVTEFPRLDCAVLAMNDAGHAHQYPDKVRFEIADDDLASYRRGADYLNVHGIDVLSVQHEYGIYGPNAGVHLLALLRELRMPIVSTLHTLLRAPDPAQRAVMDELTRLSERLVVMSPRGAAILEEVHGVPRGKIDVIPHGIPHVPVDPDAKARLGLEGKHVIFTFGLISPDKGIEHVIDALPSVVAKHPDTVYVVVGATHPHIRARTGETYRHMLQERARQRGVDQNVVFHNRFVSADELVEFLSAADVYVTPYLQTQQSTSGTLAYAVGAGKAVVSTPYVYATELLADGRGILVPPRDAFAIADALNQVIGDETVRRSLQQKAAAFGEAMGWPAVAQAYVESFERAHVEHGEKQRRRVRTKAAPAPELPSVDLEHVCRMTDDTGMIQHAIYGVPRYEEGYCIDDNARALLLVTLCEQAGEGDPKTVRALSARYLAFLAHAYNPAAGAFRNFMSYDRRWCEERGSEDSQGRTLWALGAAVARCDDPGRARLAHHLFHEGIGAAATFSSPRAWAYTLLGLDEYLQPFAGETRMQALRVVLAEKLFERYQHTASPDWPWFEQKLSYANARLPHALLVAGAALEEPRFLAAGLRSLHWLAEQQTTRDGFFAPVGAPGFWARGGHKTQFDQQPLEASTMVSACLAAHQVTRDGQWLARARQAFGWFFGQNQLLLPLYDPTTGGCRDGLHPDRANENQGAESTLSCLLALLELRRAAGAHAHAAEEARP